MTVQQPGVAQLERDTEAETDLAARVAAIARRRGWPDASDPARLGAAVAALSRSYNRTGRSSPADLAARLGFFLPRDLHKVAGALDELVASGWRRGGPPLRLLDLGAGLGASTLGVARRFSVASATLVDADAAALTLAREVLDPLPVQIRVVDAGEVDLPGPWDLIVASQLLSELDPGRSDRVARHADRVRRWMSRLAPDGALLLVEPALRERARHLHAVRDAVAAEWPPFAPCAHAAACPALRSERDWCHERRDQALPPWLVPVARAAGLSWDSLDYAFVLWRRDRATQANATHRVVSDRLESRGKSEFFLCGRFADGPDRRKVQRLDRHRSVANADWDTLGRGDRVRVDVGGIRVLPDTELRRCDG